MTQGTSATRAVLVAMILAFVSNGPAIAETGAPSIAAAFASAVAGPQRSPKFIARDAHRHPSQELQFFGLRPNMSVVEIWPGGGYWTEILAPVLRDAGHYEVALPPSSGDPQVVPSATPIGRKLAAQPAIYDKVMLGTVGKGHFDIAPPGSVDLVVTFRNLHNWMADGYAPQMFDAFFRALKSGGTLGIEEHRGHRDTPQDPRAADGYVRQDAIIVFAKAAGFVFDASSEINANPKDSANWPRGVWTLPPDLALGDKDRAMYVAIGEADNSVLRFRKP